MFPRKGKGEIRSLCHNLKLNKGMKSIRILIMKTM